MAWSSQAGAVMAGFSPHAMARRIHSAHGLSQWACQRVARGPVAAHAMHTAARRGGRRAEIQPLDGRAIGVERERGTSEELGEVLQPAIDVAADIVGIV